MRICGIRARWRLLLIAVAASAALRAGTGSEAWLRYAEVSDPAVRQRYAAMPAVVVAFGDSVVVKAAQAIGLATDVPGDGYWLKTVTVGGLTYLFIAAPNDRGVLCGAFALPRKIGLH